jgi:hypothetical protein
VLQVCRCPETGHLHCFDRLIETVEDRTAAVPWRTGAILPIPLERRMNYATMAIPNCVVVSRMRSGIGRSETVTEPASSNPPVRDGHALCVIPGPRAISAAHILHGMLL